MSSQQQKLKVFADRNDYSEKSLFKPLRDQGYDVQTYEGSSFMWILNNSESKREYVRQAKGASAIVVIPCIGKIDREIMESIGPSLKVIATHSVGFDHIDLEAARALEIRVGNTADVLTDSVAEHTICLIIMTLLRVKEQMSDLYTDAWRNRFGRPDHAWLGNNLFGKTVGLVGLGRIGAAVAERLKPFKVKEILYSSRSDKDSVVAKRVEFSQLLQNSDVVVITCSLNDSTKGLFNKEAFDMMKPTACLINISRGAIVNQPDLIQALKTGKILRAGLDVTTPEPLPHDHELMSLKQVTLTPHMATEAIETRADISKMVVDNIRGALEEGREMPSEVLP